MELNTCLYNPISHELYSFIVKGNVLYTDKKPFEMLKERPELIICSWDFAEKAMTEHFITDWQETTGEHFRDMLEVLPPINWKWDTQFEMFQLSEMTWGTITATYVRIRDKHFMCERPLTKDIYKLVNEIIEKFDI